MDIEKIVEEVVKTLKNDKKMTLSLARIKMSTAKLAEEVKSGGSLEGLDTRDGLIFLGGGAPLVAGGKVIGGIGISGGTAKEDTAYAETAVKIFNEII